MALVPCKIAVNSGLRAAMVCLGSKTEDFDRVMQMCAESDIDEWSEAGKRVSKIIDRALRADEKLMTIIAVAQIEYTDRVNELANLIP